jgi:hypothetical protein
MDANEIAKAIVDAVTQEQAAEPEKPDKNPAAVELGRLGGLKGGKARAKKLTAKQRVEIARNAALARWRAK